MTVEAVGTSASNVKCGARLVVADQICCLCSRPVLAQNAMDVFFCEPDPLHPSVPLKGVKLLCLWGRRALILTAVSTTSGCQLSDLLPF
jgi:hypothetical protein